MAEQEIPLPYETPDAPSEAPATGESQPQTPQAPAQGQAGVVQGQPDPLSNINLDNLPQFQQWKSKMDSNTSQLMQRLDAATVRQQALESELNRIRTAGMDEPERLAWERDQALNAQRQLQHELATVRYNEQLRNDAQEMSSALNIPVQELMQSFTPQDDPHTRWLKALDIQRRRTVGTGVPGTYQNNPYQGYPYQPQGTGMQPPVNYGPAPQPPYSGSYTPNQMPPSQNPANIVDVGRGTSGSLDRYNAAYERAYENNDLFAMLDIEEAAAKAGVPINRKSK